MQGINKSMINIIPINSLSSEITSTNPIDLQLTLRQSFLILYESGHSLMTGILPRIWKPIISETVLGAKISLFNRLANNAPRRAVEGELDNSFLQWMEEKSSVLDDTDELERHLSESRLNRISSSALDYWKDPAQRSYFPLLHLMTLDILSILVMSSEGGSLFRGQKTLSYSRCSLNIERYSSYSIPKIMVSERTFHQIRNCYGFGRSSWGLLSSTIHVKRFSLFLNGIMSLTNLLRDHINFTATQVSSHLN